MSGAHILPLTDAAFWADPYPAINALREATRVAVTDAGVKVILRHADVEQLLNGGAFINEGISLLERRGFVAGDPIYEWRKRALGSLHGEDHRRIRSLVGRAITHHSVDALRPMIRRHAIERLTPLLDQPADFVTAVAEPLPLAVISDYLGIAPADRERVDHLVRQGQADAFGVNVTAAIRTRVNAMFATLLAFIDELIEARRIRPQNDLLTKLLDVEELGDRLSRKEVVVLFLNLFVGATESTASAMMTGTWLLGRQPELVDVLHDDPSRVPAFVEEALRLYPPNLVLGNKIAGHDVEIFDTRFAAGESVVVPLAAPNRDPRVFAQPDSIVLDRPPARHFTFSLGSHFCLGQALARCQLQEYFACLTKIVRRIELAADKPEWVPFAAVNAMVQLNATAESRGQQ